MSNEFTGIIVACVVWFLSALGTLILEYGFFQNRTIDIRRLFFDSIRNLPFVVLIIFGLCVFLSNFYFYVLIPPDTLNKLSFIIGGLLTALLIICFLIVWRQWTPALQPVAHTLLRLKFSWLGLYLVCITTSGVYAAPRYLIVVSQIENGEQASTLIADRIRLYLEFSGRQDIIIRNHPCIGGCPSPNYAFNDQRVLLFVSGKINNKENSQFLTINLFSNCTREPSPLERQYKREEQCIFEQEIPLNRVNERNLDAYLPLWLLNPLAISSQDISPVLLVRQAVEAMDDVPYENRSLSWNAYNTLFYNILYWIPNLSNKERIDATGEVLARMNRLFANDRRFTYIIGRWWEEKAVQDKNNLDTAIEKYQGVLIQESSIQNDYIDTADTFEHLGTAAKRLNQYADAVCYYTESVKQNATNQRKQLLADALDILGVKDTDTSGENRIDIPGVSMSSQDLRRDSQKEEPLGIDENFSRSEIALSNQDFDTALRYVENIKTSTFASPAQKGAAIYLEARIKYGKGDLQGAVNAANEFVLLIKENEFNNSNLRLAYSHIGFTEHALGKHDLSADAYRKTLEVSVKANDRAIVLAQLAHQLLLQGDYQAARDSYSQAYDDFNDIGMENLTENEIDIYMQMLMERSGISGDEKSRTNDYQTIRDYYLQLISDANKHAAADFRGCQWVGEHFYSDQPNPYAPLASKVKDPVIPADHYYRRRIIYSLLGDQDSAKKDALAEIAAREKNPRSAVDFYYLGEAQFVAEQYEAVIDSMKEAIARDNSDEADDISDAADYNLQGLAYWRLGDLKMAKERIGEAARLQMKGDPRLAATYYYSLGEINRKQDEYIEAGKNYELAAINRSTADVNLIAIDYFLAGNSYLQQAWNEQEQNNKRSYLQQALSAYRKRLDLQHDGNVQAGTWFNIGQVYLEWGMIDPEQYQNAINAWNQAIFLDNPDLSIDNSDPRDVADYYELAITYKKWFEQEGGAQLLEEAVKNVELAVQIPIQLNDPDQHWREKALALQKELAANNP